jgi:cytosine/adenosine deaminase-related metal-dependent hydrolase
MLLRNLQPLFSAGKIDIRTHDGSIVAMGAGLAGGDGGAVVFEDAIVFPGLINSHDHLDYNLFPALGNRLYKNYVEWGADIHANNKEVINNVLSIPLDIRVKWGIYKNLVNGITTVVNHGALLDAGNDIITVHQDCNVLHSVQNEKRWKYKLNHPKANANPFVIHIGEGTDKVAADEIDTLIKWNILKRGLVGVHGIAMNEKQAAAFKALVWCPASNYFLNGQTAAIDTLKQHVKILFGTDSAVSSPWDLWEHIRLAMQTKMASAEEIYNMLTETPAEIWALGQCGKLEQGYEADIVVARSKDGLGPMGSFLATNPADILLVMHKGCIRLFDASLLPQLAGLVHVESDFTKVGINGSHKFVYGGLGGLIASAKQFYPGLVFPVEAIG